MPAIRRQTHSERSFDHHQPGKRSVKRVKQTKQMTEDQLHQVHGKTVAVNNFSVGTIVWCKIKGFRHWPARIVKLEGKKITVFWYNDYRISTVSILQLTPFVKFCKKYSKSATISLSTAIKEALIDIKNQMV